MRRRTTCALILVAVLCGLTLLVVRAFRATYWSAAPSLRRQVEFLKTLPTEDVYFVQIISGGRDVTLTRPGDNADIDRLIQSLKHLAVIDAPTTVGEADRMLLVFKRKSGESDQELVVGCLDPARAPYVSENLRSDNLGKVVHDIFRRKGVEPIYR